MENNNSIPVTVGKLPKSCYTDPQELANDIVGSILFSDDYKEVIKGAQGEKGNKGEKGNPGAQGPAGANTTKVNQSISIGNNATYVEYDIFVGWETAIFNIGYNGRVLPTGPGNAFDASDGYIGVGTTVIVDQLPQPTKLRTYFTFAGGITATPDANFILRITNLV